jgi:hypothetical protein
MAVTKLKKQQEKVSWEKEIQNRLDFGISNDFFWKTAYTNLSFSNINYYKDFETLYLLANADYTFDKARKKALNDSVKKYKLYTFSQLKNSGCALQLSLVCNFVYIIEKYDMSNNNCKIKIYHRIKNASSSNVYPEKVKEIFKKDTKCRAVAYLYKESFTRCVFIEKLLKNER